MRIQEPNNYKGELGIRGNPFWISTEDVFIVNGEILKADGDFLDVEDHKINEIDKLLKKHSEEADPEPMKVLKKRTVKNKHIEAESLTDDENDNPNVKEKEKSFWENIFSSPSCCSFR